MQDITSFGTCPRDLSAQAGRGNAVHAGSSPYRRGGGGGGIRAKARPIEAYLPSET